jgi:hypothetical protein
MSNMARLTDDHRPVATRTMDELHEVLDGVTGWIEIGIDVKHEEVLFKLCRGPKIAIHEGDVGTIRGAFWNGGRPLI